MIDTCQTVAAIGGCVATDENNPLFGRAATTPLCGQFHVFNTIGQNDTTYTANECLTTMQVMAVTNGCNRLDSDWCPVVEGT